MKRTNNELWKMIRIAFGCAIAFISIVIGLPGRLLSDVALWLICVADRVVGNSASVMFADFRTRKKG